MATRELSISAKILLSVFTIVDLLPRRFEPRGYFNRVIHDDTSYQSYANALNFLESKGLIRIFKKTSGEKFIELTYKGQMETLLLKARQNPVRQKWDGKWRLIIFDIPEDARDQRAQFRWLLKKNGFIKLQASVFINPYPLNREAVEYLKQTGLINYIRILKVEEMDNDAALRKQFQLAAYA